MRFTRPAAQAAKAILKLSETEDSRIWGYEIMQHTGLVSATVYTVLARFEQRGWLTSAWTEDRRGPLRRYYQITEAGKQPLTDLAESLKQ